MRLAAMDLAAGAQTLLYTAPADMRVTCTLRFCNRTPAPIQVRTALCAAGAALPTNADFLLYDGSVPGLGLREETSVVVEAGERLFVQAGSSGVNAVLWGVRESV